MLVPTHAENLSAKWVRRGHLMEAVDLYDLATCAKEHPAAFGEAARAAQRRAGGGWLTRWLSDLAHVPEDRARRATPGAAMPDVDFRRVRIVAEALEAWLAEHGDAPEPVPAGEGVEGFLAWAWARHRTALGRGPAETREGAWIEQRQMEAAEAAALVAEWEEARAREGQGGDADGPGVVA